MVRGGGAAASQSLLNPRVCVCGSTLHALPCSTLQPTATAAALRPWHVAASRPCCDTKQRPRCTATTAARNTALMSVRRRVKPHNRSLSRIRHRTMEAADDDALLNLVRVPPLSRHHTTARPRQTQRKAASIASRRSEAHRARSAYEDHDVPSRCEHARILHHLPRPSLKPDACATPGLRS